MNKHLNRFFKRPSFVAVELFSSGWCNLNCRYCYIPKSPFLKEIHKNIIKRIKDGRLIKELKELYNDDLEVIAHWGTEPTLTISLFKDFYKEAIDIFPKLYQVKVSSNFMTDPNILVDFISNILPTKKSLNFSIQVSIDGPEWITDKNRSGGSAKKIVENVITFTKKINKIKTIHTIDAHVKPTLASDDFETMASFKKAKEYYQFFDDFFTRWLDANNNNKIRIQRHCDPTIVVPGAYTVQDGKNFYKMLLNQLKLQKEYKYKSITKPESNYYHRLGGKFPYYKEFFTKHKMFTCSAGDTQIGFGNKADSVHMCHGTFYIDDDDYMKSAEEYGLNYQHIVGLRSGRMDILRDKYITIPGNDYNFLRWIYKERAYHDFARHMLSSGISTAIQMAKSGQISKCFENEQLALMLCNFCEKTNCPVDDIVISGSQMTALASILRLFGNGFAENIFTRIRKDKRYFDYGN